MSTPSRGGARPGAGRPKGSGRFGESTRPLRIPETLVSDVKRFVAHQGYRLPLYGAHVAAGFPSPADDYLEGALDLNEHLIAHPSATFLVRATGDSMIQAGIFPDDLLIVDRSLTPQHHKIVIAALNGELTVKRLHQTEHTTELHPENPDYPVIRIRENDDIHIWGVVVHVIHAV